MACPDCGAQTSAGANYCTECGAEIPDTAQSTESGMSKVWIATHVFGLLIILSGLSSMISGGIAGIVGGILFLTSSLLLMPLTRTPVVNALSRIGAPDLHNLPTVVLALIVLVGLVSGSIIMPPGGSGNTATVETPTPNVETPDVTETPQPTTQETEEPVTQTRSTSTPTATVSTDTETESGPKTEWVVTVVSVTDGDTIDVRMPDGSIETIRLLGVDTPENSASETSPDEWEGIPNSADSRHWLADWGDQASSYAVERLAGKEIYIKTDPESDRRGTYDRLLVYAYQSENSEKSFNLRLIENGYARMYDTRFSQRSVYESAEAGAQQSDTGVWDYTEPTSTPTTDEDTSEPGKVIVASVHEDADGNDHDNLNDEYIVLRNDGRSSVDMGGWTLSDSAGHTYYFPSGFSLESGETVTIYTGSGSDSSSELYWGSGRAVWNNGGDTIIVTTDDGKTVIEYEY